MKLHNRLIDVRAVEQGQAEQRMRRRVVWRDPLGVGRVLGRAFDVALLKKRGFADAAA